MEMAWQSKMLLGKVSSEREDTRRENNKEHMKLLNEILRCLSSLETTTRLLTEVETYQKAKLEQLAAQFHLYLCYIHHIDIMPADGKGVPTHIRNTCTIPQKEENKGLANEGKKNIIILD
jgi:hypothetical protein